MELTQQKRQDLIGIATAAIQAATNTVDALNTADDTKAAAAVDELISGLMDTAKRLHDKIAKEV